MKRPLAALPRAQRALALALVVVGGAAMLKALAAGMPGVVSQYRLLMVCFGVAFVMAALPLNLLMGYAGQLSLGHAAFLGLGAFTSGIAVQRGASFLVAALASALLCGVLALVIGLPALRLRGLYLALVTLGFGLAVSGMVFTSTAFTGGYAGVPLPRPVAGAKVFTDNADFLLLILLPMALVWALDRRVTRSKVGRAFRALRENEDVTAALGVDVSGYKLYAFVLYGLLTGLAGSMLGHVIGVAQMETFTFDLSLLFVVVVVLGGLGSRIGVASMAFALAVAPRIFSFLEGWDLLLGPAVLLVSLVRHPGGLAQLLSQRKEHARRSGSTDAAGLRIALPQPVVARAPVADVPLRVAGVSKRFGGRTAVEDVTLDVRVGEVTGLIGPNGAGKTTLFNVVSGLVQPDAGTVTFEGRDITRLPVHQRAALGLGRSFQQVGLIKSLSVEDNLCLAQHRLLSYSPLAALLPTTRVRAAEREAAAHSAAAVGVLGLEPHRQRRLGDLSHGQQRIVELAALVMTAPAVLLLDEPTAGMSPAVSEALAERVRALRDELGLTVFVIEHHLPFVRATCDRVHVMDSGRLLLTGTPEETYADPRVAAAYLGDRKATA